MKNTTINSPKISNGFVCEKCDYICSKKGDYNKHLQSVKHNTTNTTKIQPSKVDHICECGKSYKYRQGLHYHKKTCNTLNEECLEQTITSPSQSKQVDSSLVLELLNQNKELHQMVIELAKKAGNTTNNTNNTINNNKFNLNVFLNETCKDAINLNDFIQSIELTIRDFVNTGEVGYVKGISDIMLERIRDMEPHVRPIHCTDLKRETVYVKDSDSWAKEDENKTHIRKAVRIVANKNKEQIHSWIQENPNYEILDTPECDKFFEYSKASLGGYGKHEDSRFENKIISNVLKEVVVDKENTIA